MNDRIHSGSPPDGKPEGRRGPKRGDHYSWHRCYHDKALAGVSDLRSEQRGVYITLYWLCYSKHGPLPADDEWLARMCNEPLRKFRRIKAELVARGRIIEDLEAGLIYDERTLRELTDAGVFSQAQVKRAEIGGQARKRRPELALIEGGNGGNIPTCLQDSLQKEAEKSQLSENYFGHFACNHSEKSETLASHEIREDKNPHTASLTSPARAASPPNGGGARIQKSAPDSYPPVSDRSARMAAMKQRLAAAFPEELEPDRQSEPPSEEALRAAADRIARRT